MMNDTHGTQHSDLQRNPAGSALKLKPLLLGNGRLAKHLRHYFQLLDIPHDYFENARNLSSPELHRKLKESNAIWILTSDRAIAEIKTALEKEITGTYTWIHSSAATEIEGMITLHPLMTFGPELYSLEQYQQIPFAVMGAETDAVTKAENPLHPILSLPNTSFTIAREQRALYHAFAVMMSNLPVLLWSLTSEHANRELGLSPEVYAPILKQTLNNFLNLGANALTGPIARKDQLTIDKNLTALSGVNQLQLTRIYESFLEPKNTPTEPRPTREHLYDHRT